MNKIISLEGIRGLCCFIVIIDHCVNIFMPSLRFTGTEGVKGEILRVIALSPLNIVYSGLPSVYIFFILSGFVLSFKYNNNDDKILISGVIKRYFRLAIPILVSMMFIFMIYKVSGHITGKGFGLSLVTAIKQAIFMSSDGDRVLYNYPLWTIPYEIYGSFLVFSLLAIFGRSNIRLPIYLICLLLSVNTFYSMFIFGLIISDLSSRKNININRIFLSIMFFLGILFISTPLPRDGVETGIGIYSYVQFILGDNASKNYDIMQKIGCPLIFVSLFYSIKARSFFESSLFQFLGKISFSAYILHAGILSAIKNLADWHGISNNFISFLILSALSISITILISVPFERFIDIPTIRYTNKISKHLTNMSFNKKIEKQQPTT
ncbi:acyltransferase family protein [Budvicia aquatica]|uniref:Acyltransferase n=1 Tax=Budvicia aquatica TaxID=82979 RepID=A0A2C6DR15_9GAMM|nr:acyltransferase [Budvicia aquatica]PHI31647.1 acyltransferase [Budvicia aquatica]VFS52320.1 Acyltransferase family [Budvicia aquatica]